jgi:hypothetical protein
MFGQKDNITAALSAAYKSMYEKKEVTREKWVPESIADEDVASFMGAAAAAAKAGKKEFKLGDKNYKVTMKKSTAKAIDEAEVDVCEECGKVHEGACESGDKDKEESKVNEAPTIMVVKPGKDEKGKANPVIRVSKDKQKEYLAKGYVLAEASEAEDYTPAYDDENEDDELVPRAEGEKAFYDAHVEAGEIFDAQDIIDATFDTIKKSGPIKA